jgi:hypothetical protein
LLDRHKDIDSVFKASTNKPTCLSKEHHIYI